MTQTLLGIVGGLAGTFLDGRYFIILTPLIPGAIHRSKALEGVERPWSWICLALSVPLTAGLLFWCGVSLNQARPNTYTPADYASAVVKKLPVGTDVSTTEIIHDPTQNLPLPGLPPQGATEAKSAPTFVGDTEGRAWDVAPQEQARFIQTLIPYQARNNFKEPLSIYYLLGKRESFLFAEDIQSGFRNGGWATQLMPRTDISYIKGLVLIQSSVELQPLGTEALKTLAKNSEIPLEVEEEPNRIQPDKFEIWVGNPKRVDPVTLPQ